MMVRAKVIPAGIISNYWENPNFLFLLLSFYFLTWNEINSEAPGARNIKRLFWNNSPFSRRSCRGWHIQGESNLRSRLLYNTRLDHRQALLYVYVLVYVACAMSDFISCVTAMLGTIGHDTCVTIDDWTRKREEEGIFLVRINFNDTTLTRIPRNVVLFFLLSLFQNMDFFSLFLA